MYLADFHIHSTFSDGKLDIPQIVDLYGSRGFGAIAITDHICESQTWLGKAANLIGRTLHPGNFPIYSEILQSESERAWDQYRMVVLPGFELTKNTVSNQRSAHILGIGTSQFLPADGEVIDLCRSIRSQGGVSIAAHPVSTHKMEKQTYLLWNQRGELFNEFDAWEVASGSILFNEVLKSGLPMIANSDFHSIKQFSSWKTVLSCEKNPQAILEAIRNQELTFKLFTEDVSNEIFSLNLFNHVGSFPNYSSFGDWVVSDLF